MRCLCKIPESPRRQQPTAMRARRHGRYLKRARVRAGGLRGGPARRRAGHFSRRRRRREAGRRDRTLEAGTGPSTSGGATEREATIPPADREQRARTGPRRRRRALLPTGRARRAGGRRESGSRPACAPTPSAPAHATELDERAAALRLARAAAGTSNDTEQSIIKTQFLNYHVCRRLCHAHDGTD
jgi:hypothetical protein